MGKVNLLDLLSPAIALSFGMMPREAGKIKKAIDIIPKESSSKSQMKMRTKMKVMKKFSTSLRGCSKKKKSQSKSKRRIKK